MTQRSGVSRRENARVCPVGWVEQSETHQLHRRKTMGFALLYPSYELTFAIWIPSLRAKRSNPSCGAKKEWIASLRSQ
jgi:hypothetical protein